MKFFRRLTIAIPSVLLVLCLIGAWLTRGSMTHLPFLRGKGAAQNTLVDQRPWQTIEALAPLAVSAEEQSLAREAERLADHEVDQAFAFALRQAAMKKYDSQASGGQIAILSSTRHGTLAGRISSWLDQRSRIALLKQAKSDTDADVVALTAKHAEFETQATAAAASVAAPNQPGTALSDTVKTRVARMAQAHALAQMHNIVEDQLETQQQLSAVYAKWLAQVQLQHSIVTHLALQSLAWIAFLVLCGVLLATAARALLERLTTDNRRLHTLRTIATLAIQLVTFGLVLLVIFGTPNQVPTILGLGAAGLTVVFQDFILAFFGWFILMGKNGIRVGDWVEINGVGGEVVEIGLFRTALLETGNWTDKGHPTGRRVTFINNFAITGQYFNFSTSGQWMWDEITVNIPPALDSSKTIEAIHNTVLKETEKDAALAEQEWQKTTGQNGLSQFKATPSVDMRPAASGVDIVVRYVIRAGDRFETRNRLYQSVIDLLHKPDEALPSSEAQPVAASKAT
jgi:small-conductance mechanosensitive channel